MIAEPIMGAGGVLTPPVGYLERVRELLSKYDILMLADEVVCGFGRTGNWFGSQTYNFIPDMMSVAKGLSSGYVPIAAAVISGHVYETVADQATRLGVFGHGFTYSGHPVAAAVAAEVLRIYKEMNVPEKVRELGIYLHKTLDSVSRHPMVGEVRGTGFLAGIELVSDKSTRKSFDSSLKIGTLVEEECRAQGVMIRNMGDVLAICPPFVMSEQEISELVGGVGVALDRVYNRL
jgi:4-aminobutyrate--pyruvate transaminase